MSILAITKDTQDSKKDKTPESNSINR